jgi:DNA-directed RNA polymerase
LQSLKNKVAKLREQIKMDYTKYVRNKELEEEMQLVGLRRYQSIVNNSVQKGQESTTKYGLQLIQSAIDPLSKAIVDFIDRAFGGAKGRRHISAKYLHLIPADICAFIILKSLMASITTKHQSE